MGWPVMGVLTAALLVFVLLIPIFVMVLLRFLFAAAADTDEEEAAWGESAQAEHLEPIFIPRLYSQNPTDALRDSLGTLDEAQAVYCQNHIDSEQVIVSRFVARPSVKRLYPESDPRRRRR